MTNDFKNRIATDRFGTPKWTGHLDISKPKIRGHHPSVYEFLGRGGRFGREHLTEVQVCQRPTATAGRVYDWALVVHGETLGTYDRKTDAQRAAEALVGIN